MVDDDDDDDNDHDEVDDVDVGHYSMLMLFVMTNSAECLSCRLVRISHIEDNRVEKYIHHNICTIDQFQWNQSKSLGCNPLE